MIEPVIVTVVEGEGEIYMMGGKKGLKLVSFFFLAN